MPSYKYNGMIPDDDPRYQEGITIMIGLGLNEKPKKNQKNKELSQSFKEMKEKSMGTKKEEKIRPEDLQDEEYLWYTIRKQWREEGNVNEK